MQKEKNKNHFKFSIITFLLITPCFIIYIPQLLHTSFFAYSSAYEWIELSEKIIVLQTSIYVVISAALLSFAYFYRHDSMLSIAELRQLLFIAAIALVITGIFEIGFGIWSYILLKAHDVLSIKQMFVVTIIYLKTHALLFLPLGVLAIFLSIFRQKLKQQAFNETGNADETSGKFGSAAWQHKKILCNLMPINRDNGIFIGTDD